MKVLGSSGAKRVVKLSAAICEGVNTLCRSGHPEDGGCGNPYGEEMFSCSYAVDQIKLRRRGHRND